MDALPCIVCGKELKNVFPDESENQAADGLAFVSHGQYGSTVFDPMDGQLLEINVCDDCIVIAGDQGRVLTARDHRHVRVRAEFLSIWGSERIERPYVPWNRDLTDDGCEPLDLELYEVMAYADNPRITWNAGDKATLQQWVDSETERMSE